MVGQVGDWVVYSGEPLRVVDAVVPGLLGLLGRLNKRAYNEGCLDDERLGPVLRDAFASIAVRPKKEVREAAAAKALPSLTGCLLNALRSSINRVRCAC